MPELPEVETITQGLNRKILGKNFSSVAVPGPLVIRSDARKFSSQLVGQKVQKIHRHGKFIFIELSNGGAPFYLKIHLGMTGQLLFERSDAPVLKHTHIIFHFQGLTEELRYRDIRRFGFLKIVEKVDSRLGPDAWSSTDEEVFSALRKKSGMLKHALLNQNVIAGLGNIYVDESLYQTKLHPRKTLESLSKDKLWELCGSIRAVLRDSIQVGGTSFRNYLDTAGSRGGFKDRLNVYGKTGRPCFCGGIIKRILVAGRSSHICPKCQRTPRGSSFQRKSYRF